MPSSAFLLDPDCSVGIFSLASWQFHKCFSRCLWACTEKMVENWGAPLKSAHCTFALQPPLKRVPVLLSVPVLPSGMPGARNLGWI